MCKRKTVCFSIISTVLLLAILEICAIGIARTLDLEGNEQSPDNFKYQLQLFGSDYERLPDGRFWRCKPETVIKRGNNTHIINRDGFRDTSTDNHIPTKRSANTRIVCLGDSVTFGAGVTDFHNTWTAKLQEILGIEYEVINMGVPGYSSFQGKTLMEVYHEQLKPDYIICGFGWNDCYPAPRPDSARVYLQSTENKAIDSLKILLRYSKLYRLLTLAIHGSGSDEFDTRVPPGEFRNNLLAISEMAENTIFLTLPQAPCFEEFCKEITHEEMHEIYNGIILSLRDEGEIVLDLEQKFQSCGDECLLYGFPVLIKHGVVVGGDPIHPNERGSQKIAEFLAQTITCSSQKPIPQ